MVSFKMHAKMNRCSICSSHIHMHGSGAAAALLYLSIYIFLSLVQRCSSIFSFAPYDMCVDAMQSSFLHSPSYAHNLLARFNLHLFVAVHKSQSNLKTNTDWNSIKVIGTSFAHNTLYNSI